MEDLKDIEKALLGSFLLYNESIEELMPIVADVELSGKLNDIFSSIKELYYKNKPVDILTVTQDLMKKGKLEEVGGAVTISQLTIHVNQSVGEYHAFLLKERQIKEQVFAIGAKIMSGIEQQKDVFDLLAELQDSLETARAGLSQAKTGIIADAVKENEDEEGEVKNSDGGLIGVSTGVPCLDERLKGWRKNKVYLIAGRPGMGKTALALFSFLACGMGEGALSELVKHNKSWGYEQFNKFFAEVLDKNSGDGAVFYSYEMSKSQLVARLLSMLTGLDSEKMGNFEYIDTQFDPIIKLARRFLSQLPLYIEQGGSMSALDLKAKTQRVAIDCEKVDKELKVVFIDYLQLMSSPLPRGKGNREQEVSTNSRELKVLSEKYAVVELSQLSRAVETRGGDKKPQLSDLRESGSIEQDADVVIFPFRPEYYGVMEDAEGNSTSGLCELIIAKQRGGRIGSELCRADLSRMTFMDFSLGSTPMRAINQIENAPF